jgi:hypothetical protein
MPSGGHGGKLCPRTRRRGSPYYIAAEDVIDRPTSADDAARRTMSAKLITEMAEAAKHRQRLPDSAAAG